MAIENKKLIGLSLSGCVYDIMKGYVKEEQVDKIISNTAIDGFEADNSRIINDAIARNVKATTSREEFEKQVQAEIEERTSKFQYFTHWHAYDLANWAYTGSKNGYSCFDVKAPMQYRWGAFPHTTWEHLFEKELVWKGEGDDFQKQCVEVATRLIKSGKVDQPRLRGEGRHRALPRARWIDCETGEYVDVAPPMQGVGERPVEYALRLLELRGETDKEPVYTR